MISGRDIIVVSGIEWDRLWQGSQEIASRLARAGNRVLYVENMGIRAPTWGDRARIVSRIKSWTGWFLSRGARQVEPGLYVYSPIVLPPFGNSRRSLNRRLLLPLIARAARSLGMRDVIVWSFLPTDTVLDLVTLLRARASAAVIVYHCTADFAELTPDVAPLRESERALLKASALVFATCRQLAERCARWNDHVYVFPNGVSCELFNQTERNADGPDITGVSSLPRPIIGYVGGLHRFVDFDLLTKMARLRPEWSWVFVGPIQTPVGELARLPNVHLLGQQPHGRLSAYLRNFDTCVVPYLIIPATATIVPTKVNEYLAAGKPVVSTELPTVCDFNRQHRVLLTASSSPEDFLGAIENSVRLTADTDLILHRVRVAKLSSWQDQLEAMSDLITARMKATRVAATAVRLR